MPRMRRPEPVEGPTLMVDVLHRLEYWERRHRLVDGPESGASIEAIRLKRLTIERGEPVELEGWELPMDCSLPRKALYQFRNNQISLIRNY